MLFVYEHFTCMLCKCTMCVQCLWRPEEGDGFLETSMMYIFILNGYDNLYEFIEYCLTSSIFGGAGDWICMYVIWICICIHTHTKQVVYQGAMFSALVCHSNTWILCKEPIRIAGMLITSSTLCFLLSRMSRSLSTRCFEMIMPTEVAMLGLLSIQLYLLATPVHVPPAPSLSVPLSSLW